MASADNWLAALATSVPEYVASLEVRDSPGRFVVCRRGATPLGGRIALGFSCFALKLSFITGRWETLPADRQRSWIDFVQRYQVANGGAGSSPGDGAFLDPAVVLDASAYRRYPPQLVFDAYGIVRRPGEFLRALGTGAPTAREQVLRAETKQAIATLRQVGHCSLTHYRGFPMDPDALRAHVRSLDWARPWAAGGQAAALAVFVATQGPCLLGEAAARDLAAACRGSFDEIARAENGAYFRGRCPPYGELVNGAMKVLSALDWLEAPVHYPERLIDTCLARLPAAEACHLVDTVYVLSRCSALTTHRRDDVRAYCRQVLSLIRRHYNPDGGFSYKVGRSQTRYLGVRIARGLPESDLHGTLLLAWAVALIRGLLELDGPGWRVIKP